MSRWGCIWGYTADQQNTQLYNHCWWCLPCCCNLQPDIPKLKGTTTAGPPVAHVPDQNLIVVPRSILSHNSSVTLAIDFVYVNKIPLDNNIQKHWLAHHCTSSESTKGNNIESIKMSNNNLQKPWSTCQLHTRWQWVCMFKEWHWFHSPWHFSSKYSCTRDWKVQPNH